MTKSALPIAALCRRLSECPAVFLEPPKIGGRGTVDTVAVVTDTIRALGGEFPSERDCRAVLEKGRKETVPAFENRLRFIALTCWILMDPSFQDRPGAAKASHGFVLKGWGDLPTLVSAEEAVRVPERREELVRRVLTALEILPAGETRAQAEDRLAALDSVEARRVMEESRAAQARNKAVIEAMRRKKAEEEAAQYGRE